MVELDNIASRGSSPDYDPFNSEHLAAAGAAIRSLLLEAGKVLPACGVIAVTNLFDDETDWQAKIAVLELLRRAAMHCRAESWSSVEAPVGSG
ncbi:hypothetical protein [Novosphingobium sp.]|uniref:hypothetical protein n=1 Tax=Novosphingobium sp. TaxID=1874826 RepID=UPI0028A8E976|nr:hypothetical protein [Novosphingobium sp.]